MEEQTLGATNAVATTQTGLVSSEEEERIMERMREESGERSLSSKFLKLPVISVDNSKVMASVTMPNGTTSNQEVLCQPGFIITEKVGDEYKKQLFADKFEAVILSVRYFVKRKWHENEKDARLPFYKSLEFKSFDSMIYVRQEKSWLNPMTYKQLQLFAGDENELWGVIYFMAEGEDIVRKMEVKGASRSAMFDYVKASRTLPLSATYTLFSATTNTSKAFPFNHLVLENTERKVSNILETLMKQEELNNTLAYGEKPSEKSKDDVVIETMPSVEDLSFSYPIDAKEGEITKVTNSASIEDLF